MKKKQRTIMILGAGLEQSIAIRLAKRMGCKVIAVDNNPKAIGFRYADVAVATDTSNIEKLVALGRKYRVQGVMTHGVEIPGIVARVAKQLGLPHLDPAAADRATDKIARIKVFKKAGIPTASFAEASTVSEAIRKAKNLGFPVVIKPVDNAGARGVKKVANERELRAAFDEAVGFGKHSKKVLLEKYLQGREISTEALVVGGNIVTTGFADRNYSRSKEFAPYFVEDGHSVPSTLSKKERERVIAMADKAIRALGITWGVAKGDILVKGKTVYVIEMAARTSGGWFAAGTVPHATGVELLRPLILMSLGEAVLPRDYTPSRMQAACQRYIIPDHEGAFVRLEGVASARRMKGVKVLQIFHTPHKGEKIHKARNNAERYGHIIAVGDTVREATRLCEQAIKKIRIVTK